MSTINKDFKVKNGLSVGGDIDLVGTVDGRDIATDGGKLDNIALSANNYTHPSNHDISVITGLQQTLDDKVDDTQVLTDVPAGALFTDTVYGHPTGAGNTHIPSGGTTGQFLKYSTSGVATWATPSYTTDTHRDISDSVTTTDSTISASQTAVKLAYDRSWPDTTYSVGDGGLSENNFTNADHTKLNDIDTGATVDQTKSEIDALGINATQVSGFTVGKSVPSNAVFTDTNTETTTSISHNGPSRTLSYVDELGATTNIDLTQYIDDTNLAMIVGGELDGPSGIATFTRDDQSTFTINFSALLDTDTDTWRGISDSVSTTNSTISASQTAVKAAYDRSWPDTTYSVGDGGLSQNNFTDADHDKLNDITSGATGNQTATELLTSIKTVDGTGSGLDADLLDGQHASAFAASSHTHSYLPLAGGNLTGGLVGTTGTFVANAAAGTNALNLLGSTNANGVGITFSDNGSPPTSASGQHGYMYYYHSDGGSYGSTNAFVLTSSEVTTTILADGKLMYNEGIYVKPATGTGAGTRKDSNWDTAYGWGDHASAGYTNDQTAAEIRTLIASSPLTATHLAASSVGASEIGNDVVNSQHYAAGSIDNEHMAVNSIDSVQYVDGSIDRVHLAADIIDSTKIADNAINSEHYVDGSIDNVHMAANSIDSSQYVDGSIDNAHIANGAINSEHYAAGSIDNEHMAVNSIDSSQYVDGSIDRVHLAADIIDSTKIADNAINSEHYVDGSIDNEHMAANSIDSVQYVDGSIDRVHLAADIIDSTKIADNAINSEHYADNSIDALHLNVSGNGSTTQYLRSDGDGSMSWVTPPDTNTDNNTTYSAGSGISLSGTTFTNSSPNVVQTTVSGSAGSFTGSLSGDVTGTQGATVVGNNSHTHDSSTITGNISSAINTVVQRDANGDINARLFKSEYDITNSQANYFMTQVDTASNNFIRPSTPTQVRASLNVADGANNYSFPHTVSADEGDNTVVQRDAWGGIHAEILHSSITFGTNPLGNNMGLFTGTNGSDTYGRSYNAAAARELLNVEDGANNYSPPADSTSYLVTAGNDYGIGFWGGFTYAIQMGNSQANHGTVTDYSMHHNMGADVNRGFTFGSSRTAVSASINALTGAIVSNSTVTATGGNSTEWNTAYDWGNHASGGYAASSHTHDYAATSHTHSYLPLAGGTMTSDTHYSNYGLGMVGLYSATRWQGVFSMGAAYMLPADGSSPSNLYGISWTHSNVGGQSKSVGHQACFMSNGITQSAVGTGIWTIGNVTAYSDIRVKENLVVIPNAINKVKQLSGYTFDRTDLNDNNTDEPDVVYDHNPTNRYVGVVAQDVLKVLPEAVTGGPNSNEGSEDEHYAVAYGNLVALLIESTKEQQGQIEDLKGIVEAQQGQIDELKELIA